jgi:hypothetical protein
MFYTIFRKQTYVAIALNTTVDPSQLSYEKGLKIYDDWESFVNHKVSLILICTCLAVNLLKLQYITAVWRTRIIRELSPLQRPKASAVLYLENVRHTFGSRAFINYPHALHFAGK